MTDPTRNGATIDAKLQTIIGTFVFQIAALQLELEQAQARIRELEGRRAAGPPSTHVSDT